MTTSNETSDGGPSDLLADVMSSLSSNTPDTTLASSPTRRKGGLKGAKTKKIVKGKNAESEDYIDESLVADVRANLYEMDDFDNDNDYDDDEGSDQG
jgi:hypothetical protein